MRSWLWPLALSVLASSTAARAGQGWPYDLPKDQKYWPEHEHLARRHVEVQQQLATQSPVGVKKMSDDPSEMFFLDYWLFEPEESEAQEHVESFLGRRGAFGDFTNVSMTDGLLPPLLPHSDDLSPQWAGLRNSPRDIFQKRDFQCPSGTNACTSINRPNSCCATDETCVMIQDTGIGDVGCCPQGSTCGGSVSSCNTAQGYQSCPGADSGGCCIPHYSCNGIGCAAGGTTTSVQVVLTTVTITPGDVTVTSTSSPQSPPTTTTSTITPSSSSTVAPSTSTVFTTLPTNTDTTVVPANSTSTSAQCTSGFNSCPASMDGGCCPTDRACGTGGTCLPLSTTTTTASSSSSSSQSPSTTTTTASPTVTSATAAAPIRPTSGASMCPTGYYMCSAYYIGGCCQNNRNCDTTDCPATGTQTVVSNGETIVVPGTGTVSTVTSSDVSVQDVTTGATVTTTGTSGPGQCATGWSLCAASQGGGCCPSGYGCGASCTATAAVSPNQVAKAAPASGSVRVADSLGPLLVAACVGVGAAMLLL